MVALGVVALVLASVATVLVQGASARIPGSLVFSAVLLVVVVIRSAGSRSLSAPAIAVSPTRPWPASAPYPSSRSAVTTR